MTQTQLPCWLKPKARAVAVALLEAGYIYCGTMDEFHFYEEYAVRCGQWRIAGSPRECVLDVEWDGALFSKCMEIEENPAFEGEIKRVKQLIRSTEKAWEDARASKYCQLSLF